MNGASVFSVIALIPDRMARTQSGTRFDGAASERAGMLSRFLGWLGPLSPISKEDQQLLGVRAGGGRSLAEGDEALEPTDIAEESDQSLRVPGRGTHIAA